MVRTEFACVRCYCAETGTRESVRRRVPNTPLMPTSSRAAAHRQGVRRATRESVPWVDQLGVDLACPMSQKGCRRLSLAVTARSRRRVGPLTTRSAA